MNRYHIVKEIVFKNIENKDIGLHKCKGYEHLFQVSALCHMLAIKRELDEELCSIIGLLHDYSTYILHTSFDHANKSSSMANELLNDLGIMNNEEIKIIVEAIKNHSAKDKIHDAYSEIIKDADVYQEYLEGNIINDVNKKRLEFIEF